MKEATKKNIQVILEHLKDNDLRWVAGSLSFSTVLSIVPFLMLTISVFQLIGGLEFLEPKVEALYLYHFKQAVGSEAGKILKDLLNQVKPETVGITSIGFLLMTSLRLLQDIDRGINRMWGRNHERSWGKRILVSWIILAGFILFLAAYSGFRSLDFLRPIFRANRKILDWSVLSAGLFLIYKYIPQVVVRWRSAVISAMLAGTFLIILQDSFSFIAKTFFRFNKIYGSVATIPLMLVWILFVWYVVLAGAALTSSIDKFSLQHRQS